MHIQTFKSSAHTYAEYTVNAGRQSLGQNARSVCQFSGRDRCFEQLPYRCGFSAMASGAHPLLLLLSALASGDPGLSELAAARKGAERRCPTATIRDLPRLASQMSLRGGQLSSARHGARFQHLSSSRRCRGHDTTRNTALSHVFKARHKLQ